MKLKWTHGLGILAGLASTGWVFIDEQNQLSAGEPIPLSIGTYQCKMTGRSPENVSLSLEDERNSVYKVVAGKESMNMTFRHVSGDRYLAMFNADNSGVTALARISPNKFEHLTVTTEVLKKHADKAGVTADTMLFTKLRGTPAQKRAFFDSVVIDRGLQTWTTCTPVKRK
jgi:hypothetical protein